MKNPRYPPQQQEEQEEEQQEQKSGLAHWAFVKANKYASMQKGPSFPGRLSHSIFCQFLTKITIPVHGEISLFWYPGNAGYSTN